MSRRNRIRHSRIISFLTILTIIILSLIALGVGYLLPFFLQYSKPGIYIDNTTPDQRITVLLLGIGGGSHDGPLLTDTMQLASIDLQHNKLDLISIPRDLWNPDIQQKINATYAFAEQKKTGSGLQTTKATVGTILGQAVSYGFRIDFSGFVKAVDDVGGLDITVVRTLDDFAYPVDGKEEETCGHTQQEIIDLSAQIATGSASEIDAFSCRYMHLHIAAGLQHMNGEIALEYVRSRHAQGFEGSDFARSARQQKVIEAFRSKLLSTSTILNPARIISLVTILKDSIDTDIPKSQISEFIKLFQQMKSAKIYSYVIDYSNDQKDEGDLLIQGNSNEFGGAYVLIPRAGLNNYSQIQRFVGCKLQNINCPTPTLIPQTPTGLR